LQRVDGAVRVSGAQDPKESPDAEHARVSG
jgi:hypothetical protein